MPPKKAGKKPAKKGKGADVNPAELIPAFQKGYARLAKERGLDGPLRLGAAEDNGVLDTEQLFTRVVLHPQMPGPPCGVAQFVTLLDALGSYKFLRCICVWSIPLGNEGCARLGRYLKSSQSADRVELLDCAIGAAGCAQIASAVKTSRTLTRLTLDHNPLGSGGVGALSDALQQGGSALQSLSLRFCGIAPDGAEACARLVASSQLRELDLRGSELQARGVLLCLAALRENAHMVRIGLACTSWGLEEAVVLALLETIRGNTTCNAYDIDGNPISDAHALELAAALRTAPHVTSLVTTDQLTPAAFHEIVKLTGANLKDWVKRNKKKKGKKGAKK